MKDDTELAAEVKAEIAAKTTELRQLRQEVKLCEGIANRSNVIKERIKTVHDDETKQKEETQHDQFRGRSRTNR